MSAKERVIRYNNKIQFSITMISEFVKRPSSKQANMRPITGNASEANIKQSDECFEIGKKHMRRKQYQQALTHYSNAIIHNPKNFKALCNMGAIYKENHQYTLAKEYYLKALFVKPKDHIALYNLGNLERIIGCDELAISHYDKVRKLKEEQNKQMGDIYYNTLINEGICYKNLRLYDEAIACNNKAIQFNSKDETSFFNKSMCLLKKIYGLSPNFNLVRLKLCDETKQSLQKVIQINPQNFYAKLSLVEIIFLKDSNQQNLKSAIKQFQMLKKIAKKQDLFEIDVKIKYCENLLSSFEQKKIIKEQAQKNQQRNKMLSQLKKDNIYDKDIKNNQNKTVINNQKIKTSEPRKSRNQIPDSKKIIGEEVQYKKQANEAKPNSSQVKKLLNNYSPQIEKYLKQGKSMTEIINILIDNKKYDEAFQLTRSLPQGKQKYETQIIINFLQSEETQNDAILESALAIYNQYIIMRDQNTPITKDTCSLRGHDIMARMLNITQNYTQASKHYSILLELLQDKKLEQKNELQIKDIRAQLGVCYAEQGKVNQAIIQLKKSLQLQPQNYFLITNLCCLLIEDGKRSEAKKYYEDYLAKHDGQNMKDKIEYIDCLLNISICERDLSSQHEAIQKTLSAIQKYFPTYQLIKQKLNEAAVVGLYLRKADLLQQKYHNAGLTEAQKKQAGEKLLDLYLNCLQFQVCPDRQAIAANAGILFYLNGCYANSLALFKTIVVNKNLMANNMALSLIRLQEYEKALTSLKYAVEQYPENIVYSANFEIVKWICGISTNKIIDKYNCQCERMFIERICFGLWMLDELTDMIGKNQIQYENATESQSSVSTQVKIAIEKLLERSQNILTQKKQPKHNKIIFVMQLLKKHMQTSHKGEQVKKNKVSQQIMNLCLKKCLTIEQFKQNCIQIINYTQKIKNQYESQYLIIQSIICLTLANNSHFKDAQQTLRSILINSERDALIDSVEFFESKEFKQAKEDNIFQKKATFKFPNLQLNIKTVTSLFNDIECVIENSMRYIIQHIENIYYFQASSILYPLDIQYTHPHCENLQDCPSCLMNASTLYSSFFGKKMIRQANLNRNQTIKEQTKHFAQNLYSFVHSNLYGQKGIYSKQENTIKVKLGTNYLPFRIISHHKNYHGLSEFVKNIDQSFAVSQKYEKMSKGVITATINKALTLEMWWGEQVSVYDKFYKWFIKRESNLTLDAFYLLDNNFDQLKQQFQLNESSKDKITKLFGASV